ncbi:MAG: thiolase domain-containing protein, partial [Gemmatimonadota bacterium]
MREVAIVAAGMTRFGELWHSSLRDLFVEAAAEAIAGAHIDRVDAIVVGNMSGGQFVGQEHLGPLMADHLGMAGTPAIRV